MAKDTSKVLITIISEVKVRIERENRGPTGYSYYDKFMPFAEVTLTENKVARLQRQYPSSEIERVWLERCLLLEPATPQCLYTFEPVKTHYNQKSVVIQLNTKIGGMPYVCAQLTSGTVPAGGNLHHLVDSASSEPTEPNDGSWRLSQDLAFPQVSLDALRPIVRHRVIYADD